MGCKGTSEKGWSYLSGHPWSKITRDERWFCHILSKELENEDKAKKFIDALKSNSEFANWINNDSKRDSIIYVKENRALCSIPSNLEWEVGYEVAFYRDLMFHHGADLELKLKKAYWEELKVIEAEVEGEVEKGEKKRKKRFGALDCSKKTDRDKIRDSIKRSLSKRTFDLCLFSKDWVIAIEAKADGQFDVEQANSIRIDRRLMKECLKAGPGNQAPQFMVFGLVSSNYPKTTNCYDFEKEFDGIFSWKFLTSLKKSSSSNEKLFSCEAREAFDQADATRHLKSLGLK